MQAWNEIGSDVTRAVVSVQAMIDSGAMFEPSEKNRGHVGAEIEICMTDRETHEPVPIGPDFVEETNGSGTSKEVVDWNAELNPGPVRIEEDVWLRFRNGLRESVMGASAWAEARLAEVVICGSLPSATLRDLSVHSLTKGERYKEIAESLGVFHRDGGVRPLRIGGEEGVEIPNVPLAAEGLANSLQIHLPLSAKKLGRDLNFAHVLLGPLTALAANSSFCLDRLTHPVGRSDIFRSIIAPTRRRELNHFPVEWLGDDGSAFTQWSNHYIQAQKPAFVSIPGEYMSDPAMLLRYYFGTAWPWVRIVIGTEPELHIRMEIRPFCALPSEFDATALAALFYGCMRYVQQHDLRAQDFLTAEQAWWNFRTGVVWGMDPIPELGCRMHWRNSRRQPRSILHELLGYAEEAMLDDGHNRIDVAGALRPAKEIICGGKENSAQWIRRNVKALRPELAGGEISVGQALAGDIASRIRGTQCDPICDWVGCGAPETMAC